MSHEPIPVLILGYTHVPEPYPFFPSQASKTSTHQPLRAKHEEKTTWGIFSEMGETTWWKYEVTKSYNSRARIPMQWRGSVKTRLSGGPCFSPWSWSSLEVADTRNKIQRAYSTNHHVNFNDNKPAIIVIETMMMMMMLVVVVMVVAVVEMGDELFYDSLWHWKASSNCHSCDRDLLFDHFLDRIKE